MSVAPLIKRTAWEIENSLMLAIAALETVPEGEVPEELATLVYECMEDALDKRDALAGARKRLMAEIALLYERAEDAQAKAQRSVKSLERLDNYLLCILDNIGQKMLKGGQYTLGWQQNPDHVEITDKAQFLLHNAGAASPLVRFVTASVEPDKRAIEKALKRGDSVPGATLAEGSRRIVVR